MKHLLLQDRKVFRWVDKVVSEAMTVEEPDMSTIDKTLLVLRLVDCDVAEVCPP